MHGERGVAYAKIHANLHAALVWRIRQRLAIGARKEGVAQMSMDEVFGLAIDAELSLFEKEPPAHGEGACVKVDLRGRAAEVAADS